MNAKMPVSWLIPAILFIAALLVILDQIVRHGVVWEWRQVLHHENLALALISLALGMLISQRTSSKGGRSRKEANTK